jgi:hypothetical protein
VTRLNTNAIILTLCGIAFILLVYGRMTVDQQQRVSVFSTYDTGPNGYRALFEVLRVAGVPVRRFERVLVTLDPSIRTLVITGYEQDPSAKALDENDRAELARFLDNGGRLVAIDSEFAGPQDVTPGVGTTLQTPGGGDAIALAKNAYTAGVARAGGTIDWTFPFKTPRGIPLLANSHGIVGLAYRYGRGEVIAITAPALFSNDQLRKADNLRFAYNVIAGHGPVAVDEYVHGYSENPTTWGVLPWTVRAAVWIALAILLVALIGANVPFAPPYIPQPPDERTSSDYITAVAALMRRSRDRPSDADVIWQAALDFQRRKEHA